MGESRARKRKLSKKEMDLIVKFAKAALLAGCVAIFQEECRKELLKK